MASLIFFLSVFLFARAPFCLFCAVIFHEAAHFFTAALLGLSRPEIKSAAGFSVTYHGLVSPACGIILCLSGPIFSIILGALSYFFHISVYFALYSAGLGLMNLIPVSSLDGGGAFRHLCDMLFSVDTAYDICRAVSVFFTVMILLFNILIQMKFGINISLFAVSLWLCVGTLSQ